MGLKSFSLDLTGQTLEKRRGPVHFWKDGGGVLLLLLSWEARISELSFLHIKSFYWQLPTYEILTEMLLSKQRTPSESKYLLLMFPTNLTCLVFSYFVASVTTFVISKAIYVDRMFRWAKRSWDSFSPRHSHCGCWCLKVEILKWYIYSECVQQWHHFNV